MLRLDGHLTAPARPAGPDRSHYSVRYFALACDYDGTLAEHGQVGEAARRALDRAAASGRKLVMVTGRQLEDLRAVFPGLDRFDLAVVENGAVLYRPATREVKVLAEPPPPILLDALRARGVDPLSVGRVVVATWVPHETAVLEAIREVGLEMQVIFNKGAVMVLPSGVNKASGLAAALAELGLSAHNAVGVGDAENDHAFLSRCELGVAVADALPMVQRRADLVTRGAAGSGVVELVDELVADDLRRRAPPRHHVLLGEDAGGGPVRLAPYGCNVLVAGTSGAGKSSVAVAVLERFVERGYQICIVDPEGDYEAFAPAVVLGDARRAPSAEEVLQVLADPRESVVANLVGLALEERPRFFGTLLARLQELRARTGRPHWIAVDEAHHLLPMTWEPTPMTLSRELVGLFVVTVHPGQMARPILSAIDTAIAVGGTPDQTLAELAAAIGRPAPPGDGAPLGRGEMLVWHLDGQAPPERVRLAVARVQHRRHRRKYAEGTLGTDRSFYFCGPAGRLRLRAQNLILFLQIGEGVDDETWSYHLERGDISRWFREAIKDEHVAADLAEIERAGLSPTESRARVRAAIELHYTLPSSP